MERNNPCSLHGAKCGVALALLRVLESRSRESPRIRFQPPVQCKSRIQVLYSIFAHNLLIYAPTLAIFLDSGFGGFILFFLKILEKPGRFKKNSPD